MCRTVLFTRRGGSCFLNESKTVQLHFPTNAVKSDVIVKYTVANENEGDLPDLELNATYRDTGERVKDFKKHVKILFTKVPEQLRKNVRITVDGEIIPKDIPQHRYYKVQGKHIVIFTKHFSKIKCMNCNDDHGSVNSPVIAKIYRRINSDWNTIELKVFFTTNSHVDSSVDDYELIDTYRVNVPLDIDETTPICFKVKGIREGWECTSNTCRQAQSISDSLPCYNCHPQSPEATALKFNGTLLWIFNGLRFTLEMEVGGRTTEIDIGSEKSWWQCLAQWVTTGGLFGAIFGGLAGGLEGCLVGTLGGGVIGMIAVVVIIITKWISSWWAKPQPPPRNTPCRCEVPRTTRTHRQAPPPPGGRLTDIHIQEISERITAPGELRRLGVKLGVPHHTIDTIFTNYRNDITEQAYHVIETFNKNMESAEEAFDELWKALCDSGHVHIAREVLSSGAIFLDSISEYSRYSIG